MLSLQMNPRIVRLRQGVEKLESWVSSLEQQVGDSSFLPVENSQQQVGDNINEVIHAM